MDLKYIYRILHLTTLKDMIFSAAHGTFCKIDVSGHKISLNKYKKIEIISCISSDHNKTRY
jgi:hypothetical protein